LISLVSGNGGTTLARALTERPELLLHELDPLVWRPGRVETPRDELRALLEPIVGERFLSDL